MATSTIGILHPGEMGVSLAAAARHGGHDVLWASGGRSSATAARALEHGLVDAVDLGGLCTRCDLIVSICPPHAAEEVAAAVVAGGFRGVFVDANAIAPARMRRIAAALVAAGIEVVDGGVIGGPAWTPGSTWLYLAGARAGEVAAAFGAGPLATEVLGPEVGTASALKMCYAATTKGTTALLAAVLGSAERLGVRAALEAQWNRDEPGSAERSTERVRRSTRKAWRFAGEMDEIAATFDAAGLPPGFHAAAADLYRRLAPFKGTPGLPELEAVLAALLEDAASGTPEGTG
jgi:3-hydroxyisobutyrate dehydrogenase-like beta-hydroxyacid dehydrogenase